MEKINVVYHSSDKFSWILGVSIYSMLKNNNYCHFNIFVIENNISDSNKELIKKYEQMYDCSIYFIPMPNIPEKFGFKIRKIKDNWLFDSFSRLFLGTLLPSSVDKVLYLDSDIIIKSDITDFYNTKMDNELVAGVMDPLSYSYYSEFELVKKDVYLQGGVILFNLALWRSEKQESNVANYMNSHNGYVFFMEQTVLSKICQGRIKVVSPKYNWTTINTEFSYGFIKRFRKPVSWYDKKTYLDGSQDIRIIHYTSCFYVKGRPWNQGCNHKLQSLFDDYKRESAFDSTDYYCASGSNLKNKIIRLIPKFVLSIILRFVYNRVRIMRIRKQRKKYEKSNN